MSQPIHYVGSVRPDINGGFVVRVDLTFAQPADATEFGQWLHNMIVQHIEANGGKLESLGCDKKPILIRQAG